MSRFLPPLLCVVTVIWIGLCWLVVWNVDFRPPSEMTSRHFSTFAGPDLPFLWIHLFEERSLIEQIQWLMLSTGVGVSLFSAFQARSDFAQAAAFLVFASGFFILYLEDAHNMRHVFSGWVATNWLGVEQVASLEWRRSLGRTVLEIVIYGLISFVMLALLFCVRRVGVSLKVWGWVFAAYLTYGVAALASVTRNVAEWYAIVGGKLYDAMTSPRSSYYSGSDVVYYSEPIGFWFLDLFFEESLELLGASLLVSVVLVLRNEWLTR